MKLCVDCKHYRLNYPSINYSYPYADPTYYASLFRANHRCIIQGKQDPVKGVIAIIKEINAYDNRDEVSHIENKCGPEGKFWEAK